MEIYPEWRGYDFILVRGKYIILRPHSNEIVYIVEGYATSVRFTASSHGNRLKAEVQQRCSKAARGMPAQLQTIANHLIAEPTHRGVAGALAHLIDLINRKEGGFSEIEFDLKSEVRDAVHMGSFEAVDDGFAEIYRRRTFSHPHPPAQMLEYDSQIQGASNVRTRFS